MHIFSPAEIRALAAAAHGLTLRGTLALEHWSRTGLDYTFIRLIFSRS